MTDKLKPCPCCGGDAVIEINASTSFRISCRNIYSCGVLQHWFDTLDEAIEAWNRRVDNDKR